MFADQRTLALAVHPLQLNVELRFFKECSRNEIEKDAAPMQDSTQCT
jgi:hypothetical protein